jgi:hypothetical protein
VSTDTAVQSDVDVLADLEPSIRCGVCWEDAGPCPAEADYAVHLVCELCGSRWGFICDPCLDVLETALGRSTTCRGNSVCAASKPRLVEIVTITPLS